MDKTGKGKTRKPTTLVGTSTQITKDGRQYRVEGCLGLQPSITVHLNEIREVRTWSGEDVPLSQALVYRAGQESEIRTRGTIRNFDEAEEVLRTAALRVLAVQESKPIRIRHSIWQHAMAASVAAAIFIAGVGGISHPMTRPYVFSALTWVGNQVFGSVAAMPAVKIGPRHHSSHPKR
jgi:hypothetical protein